MRIKFYKNLNWQKVLKKIGCLLLVLFSSNIHAQTADSSTIIKKNQQQHFDSKFDSLYYYYSQDLEKAIHNNDSLNIYKYCTRKIHICFLNSKILQMHDEIIKGEEILGNLDDWEQIMTLAGYRYDKFWADFYSSIGNHRENNKIQIKAIQNLLKKDPFSIVDTFSLAPLYRFIGEGELALGQYEKAKNYFEKCIPLEQRITEINPRRSRLGFIYKYIGDCHLAQGRKKQAFSYYHIAFQKNKKQYDDYDLIDFRARIIETCFAISRYHLNHSSLDSALYYVNESLKYHIPYDFHFSKSHSLNSKIHYHKKNYKEALFYTNKSLAIFLKDKGIKSIHTSQTYSALAQIKQAQKQYPEALEYYQKALNSICMDSIPNDISRNPNLAESFSQKELLKILIDKSKTLSDYYHYQKNNDILNHTYTTANQAFDILKKFRIEILSEADKRVLASQSAELFDILISTAQLLYQNTNQKQYLSDIFQHMEHSKSRILLEKINAIQSELEAALPKEIIDKQRSLILEIDFLKRQYATHQNIATLDAINDRKNLDKKQNEYDSLNQELKQEFPNYGKTKLFENISLAAAKKMINPDEVFIHYFLGKDNLYTLIISPKNQALIKTAYSFNIQQQVEQLKEGILGYFLSPEQSDIIYKEKNLLYCDAANKLYQQLIAPIENNSNIQLSEKIIIIPDGILAYIPFEALLSSDKHNCHSFKKLPYLFNQYNIRYAFSFNSLKMMKEQNNYSKKAIVFSPSFKNAQNINTSIAARRGDLGELKHNQSEAENISQLFNATHFSNDKASIHSFIEHVPNYGIIHIASHGKSNDQEPEKSYIAFGNKDHEKMYLSQLNALSLKAQLVTLSACEMGIGKLSKGEGIQSMGAGFAASGAKSVVSSLWSVNDETTAKIMGDFYHNLSKRKNKNLSLQEAKKIYLSENENSISAHPYYWTGFIMYGDNDALELENRYSSLIIISILIFIFIPISLKIFSKKSE